MFRSLVRLATSSAPRSPLASAAKTKEVPDVLVSFGNQADRITFVSHPGVMAISKLLEMGHITQHRAQLTDSDVQRIAEYDSVLARKAQKAVEAEVAVNFQDLEFFDRPEFVEAFKAEKKVLEKARTEVLASPPGKYEIPASVRDFRPPTAPRSWRPELKIPQEAFDVDPKLSLREELHDLVQKHVSSGETVSQRTPLPKS